MFSSCKNQNFIEYIGKGFAKPAVSDVKFSESSLGYENKIYVPSEQEIEVEFTIKNKYEKEITGTLQLPEEKKEFFHTVPYISSLTPTKMVITFKFKATAEPEAINHFLGESVPVDLRIHDKKPIVFCLARILTPIATQLLFQFQITRLYIEQKQMNTSLNCQETMAFTMT